MNFCFRVFTEMSREEEEGQKKDFIKAERGTLENLPMSDQNNLARREQGGAKMQNIQGAANHNTTE